MKKKYRLLKETDFRELLGKGNRFFSEDLVCYWKEDLFCRNIKIGIIIPKKKCKLACNRKYLKRIFWSLNGKEELKKMPKIKCVFFFRDSFYEKFKKQIEFDNRRRKKFFSFLDLKREYFWILKNISKKLEKIKSNSFEYKKKNKINSTFV